MTLVLELREENGSLNARCPSSPTPPRNRSIPPAATMALLVILALFGEIRSVAVEDVDVAGRNVHLVEQILVHEAVVALRMALRKPYIFIHVECDDILEGDLSGLVHSDELGIDIQRSGAGRQSEYEWLVGLLSLCLDGGGNVVGGPDRASLCVSDDYFHD